MHGNHHAFGERSTSLERETHNLLEGEEKVINLMCEPRLEAKIKRGKRLIIIAIL